jgi:hypothetical protein
MLILTIRRRLGAWLIRPCRFRVPLPHVLSVSPGYGWRFRAYVLISVHDNPFHSTQGGVGFLDAVKNPPPQREAGKRNLLAWSEFLGEFQLWLKLLDVLGIARPLKVMSIVSFSLVKWILSVVIGCSCQSPVPAPLRFSGARYNTTTDDDSPAAAAAVS